jgi:hypothetical protein
MMTRTLTSLSVRNDLVLQRLFERAARGLPLADGPVPMKPAVARAPAVDADELGAPQRLGGSLP